MSTHEQPGTDDPRGAYEGDVKQITDCQRGLFAYIMSLAGDPQAAEEILQETNLVLWRRLPEFEGRSKFMTWACGIALRQTMTYRRKTTSRTMLPLDAGTIESIAEIASEQAGEVDERLGALRECVAALPDRSRLLLDKRYESSNSLTEIAAQLGRSEKGLRVTLHRIRRSLAKCIETKLNKSQP